MPADCPIGFAELRKAADFTQKTGGSGIIRVRMLRRKGN
jgi:hypothetical protein